jgi:hypothetical protein
MNGKRYQQSFSGPLEVCNSQENMAHHMRFETIKVMQNICGKFTGETA